MQTPNNKASNGHWIHDDFGPRHYVAPTEGAPGLSAAEVIARLHAALEAEGGLDDSRVHVAVEEGQVLIAGLVPREDDRARVMAIAREALPGLTLHDQLAVTETLEYTA